MFEVLETARWVAEKSSRVRIDPESIVRFSHTIFTSKPSPPAWDSIHHFQGREEDMVAYLFVLDTLNFCFWPPSGRLRWEVFYGSRFYSGYYALALALKKVLESGSPLTQAQFLAFVSLSQLEDVLQGHGGLQLMDHRLENLRELGRVLLERFEGQFKRVIAEADGSSVRLVRILAENFSSFNDFAGYENKKIYFFKRAQLLVSDLHGALQGKGWGHFHDLEQLTAFADYKLPQVLRQLGILIYTAELAEKVDRMILLEPGGPEEVEIRANTIWAVELIRQALRTRGKEIRAMEIDWLLWNLGQGDQYRQKPYHRTITIYY
jgi:Queuosine salvage protein